MLALIFSLSTFFSTFFGGIFALKFRNKLHLIMSFTAGVVLAVAFFEILPEIFSIASKSKLDVTPTLVVAVFGFLLFHILEKLAIIRHGHEDEYAPHKHPEVGVIAVSGLAFHSFLDGVGIGLGFQVSAGFGIIIAFAVIAHDFTDGMNSITLMLANKNTVKKSVLFLLLDAITPLLGAASTLLFHIPERLLILYLGFFLGFLLYISASHLLPEAHSEHSSVKMIGLTILGVLLIYIVSRFTS